MLIGVPKEIKSQEYRVGLTPASVRGLTAHRQHAGRRAATRCDTAFGPSHELISSP